MKKTLLIACIVLTTFSLTALGYINWGNSETALKEKPCSKSETIEVNRSTPIQDFTETEFVYDVNSRFATTITKENFFLAKSVFDLVPKEATQGMESFRDVEIFIHFEGGKKSEKGSSDILNSAQLKLIQSAEYSTNFNIEANCKYTNPKTGEIEDYGFVYYLTVVPEKQAEFKDGQEVLVNYLKENSQKETENISMDELKPGKLYFTVTKSGEVGRVELESTSGHDSLDKKMIELIVKNPGKWHPATNSKGEKVDQKLVFSYGLMGC